MPPKDKTKAHAKLGLLTFRAHFISLTGLGLQRVSSTFPDAVERVGVQFSDNRARYEVIAGERDGKLIVEWLSVSPLPGEPLAWSALLKPAELAVIAAAHVAQVERHDPERKIRVVEKIRNPNQHARPTLPEFAAQYRALREDQVRAPRERLKEIYQVSEFTIDDWTRAARKAGVLEPARYTRKTPTSGDPK